MAKQIYSLDEDKMVDVVEPDATKDEGKKSEKESEKEEESEESDEEEEEEEKDSEKEESEEEESEESTEDKDDEKESEEEESEEESEEEEQTTVDEFIKSNFEEEYGITSQDEFKEILDRSVELLDENETLKAEIKSLKEAPAATPFKSPSQELIWNAIKDFDPERIGEGINTVFGLIGMDLEKTDKKLVLEQEFIMNNPDLPLDKARKKFQTRYAQKYTVSEKEKEDLTPEQLKEREEDLEIELEMDYKKSMRFLKDKKNELKIKSETKEEPAKVSEAVENSIKSNTEAFAEHFDGIERLTFEVDGVKNPFHYKFNKEQLTKIKNTVETHLKSPGAYDAKGKLVGGFDAEQLFQNAAFLIAGPSILEEGLKFTRNLAQVVKAEEIAKVKPSRKAKSSAEAKDMSVDAQAERMAKKKQAERNQR